MVRALAETKLVSDPSAAVQYPSRTDSRRNYLAFALLMACLIAVHFVLAFNAGATKSVSQAAVFSWTALAIIGGLGFASTFFLNRTRLRGIWDPSVPIMQRVGWPTILGLSIGIAVVAIDLLTGWSHTVASEAHLTTIHIAFPLSIPIYFGGAILVTIIYYYVLIPFIDWIVAYQLLKGRGENTVFWTAGSLLALVEPITQGDFSAIPRHGLPALAGALGDIGLNFAQVFFLRRSGLVAAATVRIGFYLVWHVIYGIFQ
jgi:hypothetical protein